MSWTNLTAHQALTAVLANYGLHCVEISGTTISNITLTNINTKPVDLVWIRGNTNTVPLIQFQDVPWFAALKNLAHQADVTIMIESGLERNASTDTGWYPSQVTVRWKDLTSRKAIAALCEAYDLSMKQEAGEGPIRITGNRPSDPKPQVKGKLPSDDNRK